MDTNCSFIPTLNTRIGVGRERGRGGGRRGEGVRERGGDTVEGMLICPSQGHKLLLYSHSDYTHWCWERERGGGGGGEGDEREG